MDFCVPETEDILSSRNSNDSMLIQFIDFSAFVPGYLSTMNYTHSFFKRIEVFTLQPRQSTTRLFCSEDKVSKFR